MGMANAYLPIAENPCPSVINRKEVFWMAGVIYMETPQCQLEEGHTGLHDGGWRIGQWNDSFSEGY